MSDSPHSRYPHVLAVVRVDLLQAADEHRFTITKVFDSEQRAQAEVDRLNALNDGKPSTYFLQLTRFVAS